MKKQLSSWWVLGLGAISLLTLECGTVTSPRAPEAITPLERVRAVQVLASKDVGLTQQLASDRLLPWQASRQAATSLPLPPGFERRLSVSLPPAASGALELQLGASTVKLKPVQAKPTSRLERDGAWAVYAEQYEATDGFVVSGNDFVEALWLLKNEAAPRRFEWEFEGPAWMKGLQPDGTGGAVVVNQQGEAVLRVRPPVAVDAEGRHVPCQLEVTESRLAVALSGEALAYPVLVDPIVEVPGAWTNMVPLDRRNGHAMATQGTKVVLFGGFGTSGRFSDTWEWDGATWTQRSPSTSPPARGYHAMATLGPKVEIGRAHV